MSNSVARSSLAISNLSVSLNKSHHLLGNTPTQATIRIVRSAFVRTLPFR